MRSKVIQSRLDSGQSFKVTIVTKQDDNLAISRTVTIIIIVAVVVIAGGVAALFLTSGGTSTTSTTSTTLPGAKVFDLTARDFGFNGFGRGPTITVKVGDRVQITLTNRGGLKHELRLVSSLTLEQGQPPAPVFNGALIQLLGPGESATITFVADKAGSYFYACFSDDGTAPKRHFEMDMFGEFVVQP